MNRKEAEEEIERISLHQKAKYTDKWLKSKGYIEGSDYERKRAEVLIKALESFDDRQIGSCLANEDKSKCPKCVALKALAQYQKSEE